MHATPTLSSSQPSTVLKKKKKTHIAATTRTRTHPQPSHRRKKTRNNTSTKKTQWNSKCSERQEDTTGQDNGQSRQVPQEGQAVAVSVCQNSGPSDGQVCGRLSFDGTRIFRHLSEVLGHARCAGRVPDVVYSATARACPAREKAGAYNNTATTTTLARAARQPDYSATQQRLRQWTALTRGVTQIASVTPFV